MAIKNKKLFKLGFQLIFLVAVFIVAFELRDLAHQSEALRTLVVSYGYFGIFLVSAISGINIFIPIPAIAFLPLFLASGLEFWLTIVVISIGMTLGDSVSYIIGKAGRYVFDSSKKSKLTSRLKKLHSQWLKKHRSIPLLVLLFFAAFIPLPNEIIIIPLAFLGYKFTRLLPWLMIGNLAFNTLSGLGVLEISGLI
jgi:membrane protein YqaA with SNARE-associated domain